MTAPRQPARTVLEQKIRERRLTLREFVEYAETFAREHGEPGTLSFRHLQRLVAGRQPDGSPLRPLRPATVRLLERIFGLSISELLSPARRFSSKAEDSLATVADQPFPLTVAVAIVMKDSDVLVVCRRGTDRDGIMWQFPAGVVKPETSARAVAIRETHRETGVHCAVIRELGNRIHPITSVVCHYLLCDYISGDARNADSEENLSVTWIDRAKLTRVISPDLLFPPILDALAV